MPPLNKPIAPTAAAANGSARFFRVLLFACVPFRNDATSLLILSRSARAKESSFFCFSEEPVHFEIYFTCICEVEIAEVSWGLPHILE